VARKWCGVWGLGTTTVVFVAVVVRILIVGYEPRIVCGVTGVSPFALLRLALWVGDGEREEG
jgi:hypothetical protein